MVDEGRVKMSELNKTLKTLEEVTNRLQVQHSKAQQEIGEAYQFYLSMLEETKTEFLKELDDIFNSRMVSLTLLTSKVEEAVQKTQQISMVMDRTRKFASSQEMLQYKSVIDSKLQAILNFNPDANIPSHELEFVSNYQAIQVWIRY
jgi:tripartite motif-containing protein 2/3